MAGFQRFEVIKAWQKARELAGQIYQISCNDKFSRDFGRRDQIRRASVSIMANIAEGNGRKTNKDFADFPVLSHGSAAGIQSHLYAALDLKYIFQEEFFTLY